MWRLAVRYNIYIYIYIYIYVIRWLKINIYNIKYTKLQKGLNSKFSLFISEDLINQQGKIVRHIPHWM